MLSSALLCVCVKGISPLWNTRAEKSNDYVKFFTAAMRCCRMNIKETMQLDCGCLLGDGKCLLSFLFLSFSRLIAPPIMDSLPNYVFMIKPHLHSDFRPTDPACYTCMKNFNIILPLSLCLYFLSSILFPKLWFSWLRQSCGHERPVFEFLRALVTLWWRGFVRSASHSCRFLT